MANNKQQLRIDGRKLGGIIRTTGKNVKVEQACDICSQVHGLTKCIRCSKMLCKICMRVHYCV